MVEVVYSMIRSLFASYRQFFLFYYAIIVDEQRTRLMCFGRAGRSSCVLLDVAFERNRSTRACILSLDIEQRLADCAAVGEPFVNSSMCSYAAVFLNE